MTASAASGAAEREPAWRYALAGALMTGGPVWQYLYVNHYPLGQPEALVLPALAGLAGALTGLVAHRAGMVIGGALLGVLLYLFVDLQLNLEKWLPVRTVFVIAACVALPMLMRRWRATIACVALGAFYLAGLVRPAEAGGARSPAGPSDAPATSTTAGTPAKANQLLVHIVLDEQWGIGGLRAAGDSATADLLRDFYIDRGFEVHEAAYSRWDDTRLSLSHLVSPGRPADVEKLDRTAFRMRSNPYFERLQQYGYSIHVYESSFMDFCRARDTRVAKCDRVPGNSVANVGYLRGAWTARAMLAARYFLNVNSYLYPRLAPAPDGPAWRRTFGGRGIDQIDRVRDDIAAGTGAGNAIFLHVLVPHRPLELQADCRTYDRPGLRLYYSPRLSDSAWAVNLERYAAQVRCVHHALGELLAAIDSTVGRDRSTVIVHGDHGSRTYHEDPTETPLSLRSVDQINSGYSTLLAIRRPGVPAAVHREPVPIQDYFNAFVEGGFSADTRHIAWPNYIRVERRAQSTDTIRVLGLAEMAWVSGRAPAR